MAQEASASKITNSVPLQRSREPEPTAEGLHTGESAGSVRPLQFSRLLTVAVLTPAQATLVAVQLLDAAGRAGAHDRAGTSDGANPGSRLGPVTLSPTGEVDVAPVEADEGSDVSELLGQLLQNARRLPAHPRPEQLSLLHRLEETAGDRALEPSARARELEGALADTLGPGYRRRLSGQLASLVRAFAYVAPSVPAAVDAGSDAMPAGNSVLGQRAALATHRAPQPAARRTAVARVAPPRPPYRGRALIRRRRRGWQVLLVLLVLVAVVAGGYFLLRGQNLGVFGSLGGGNHPAAPATTAPAHPAKHQAKHRAKQPGLHQQRVHEVATLAGLQAGTVTGVTVRKISGCKFGALCRVSVRVHLRPASTARPVGWKVGAARLCRHGISWSPVTTVTAQPGWTTVFATSSVHIPKGRSQALVAVTTTPARARSRPIPVTGSSSHC